MVKEMNLEEDGNLSVSCGNGKLRQWLIDQINSRRYPGLVWENDEKTIFRIPWKHAGKQDYNRDEDAALFKAWALFKGKYKEGVDKPDPPTWKTRLRCALNKSNDFDEMVTRSQLDISDPYKVYKIIPEGVKRGIKNGFGGAEETQMTSMTHAPKHHSLHGQSVISLPIFSVPYPDCSLHVSLFYRESLVKEVTTTSPEGCRITSSSSSSSSSSPPSPSLEDRLYAGADTVLFPYPYPQSQRRGAEKLPNVLERGILLWMTPDGLYAKRLCQSRVYWEGPLAAFNDKPNKLEKEQTTKLFDTQHFLAELQGYAHHDRPIPRHQVVLCFGDEYPDQQRQRKMITAQVEPMFARKLVYYTQQNSGHFLRGYDHIPDHEASPAEDYVTQRLLQNVQE
ncbi:interferon regulatory factor 4a [Aplochiton taeniatus]